MVVSFPVDALMIWNVPILHFKAFCRRSSKSVQVFACFDNEEVGSGTKQGAASTFLQDVLLRIHEALGFTKEEFYMAIAHSMMLSADNAHAFHPNYPESYDKEHAVYMNEGVVVKFNANQKYTSDAISKGIFEVMCQKANVPLQYYAIARIWQEEVLWEIFRQDRFPCTVWISAWHSWQCIPAMKLPV